MFKDKKQKKFWQAVAVMVGYIIGVGMFGLPFIVSQAGVGTFIIFILFFGSVQYLLHLVYANMIVVTEDYHRLPGFVAKYLGPRYKPLAFVAKIFGNMGAMLAYIIIAGIFFNELLSPIFNGSEFIYSTILFVAGAIVVYFGIGAIARFEFILSSLLVIIVLLIASKGLSTIEISNFSCINWQYFFLPYGAMLMSLDGNGSLPIVAKLLNKDKVLVKKVVRYGTLISASVIFIFTLVVVGITGDSTSPDALSGMKEALSGGIVLFSLVFGVLTISTSFLLVAEAVKETLWWDYKLNKRYAWAIAVFVPYIGYLLGLRNFITVISFVGGVAGGLSAILLILIFKKLKKMPGKAVLFKRHLPDSFIIFLIGLFICGIIYEIYHFFS